MIQSNNVGLKSKNTLPHLPDRVLEAVMGSPREDQVSSSQLFDVAKPLKLRRVYELDQQRMQLDMAMDGVIENLRHKHITFGKVCISNNQQTFLKALAYLHGFF